MPEIAEIKEDLNRLQTSMAVLQAGLDKQNETLDRLSEAFAQLSVYVEKTNQNDTKIQTLFKKLDNIYENGTKNCPVNIEKLNIMQKRIDSLNRIIILELLFLASQFVFLLIFLIEKKVI
jgi:CII-binding regulator of phage lambda lysogenization HflD